MTRAAGEQQRVGVERGAIITTDGNARFTVTHSAIDNRANTCPRTTSRPAWSSTRCARCCAWTTRGTRSSSSTTTPTMRGRRDLPPPAPRGVARAARGPHLRPRHHAADLRGAQGPALPVALRRHPDPADALALAAARAPDPPEPPDRRAALVLRGRRTAVVRRPARPGVLRLPAGRRGRSGPRRR